MKNSISKKAGIIVSAVLVISLSVMLFILLNIEENLKLERTQENIDQTAKLVVESIEFSMGLGADDLEPFVENASVLPQVTDLKVTPTDLIEEGSEELLDQEERDVLATLNARYFEEEYNGMSVFRAVEPITASEICLDCHDNASEGDPLAIVSLRYSMEETYAAINSQRFWATIMVLITIGFSYGIVMYFLKKQIVNPIRSLTDCTAKFARGEEMTCLNLNSDDEISELAKAFGQMADKLSMQLGYLENLPTPVMTVNTDFDIMYMNKIGGTLLGTDNKSLVGKKCYDMFKTDDCNTEKCSCWQAMNKDITSTEETIARPQGKEIPIIYTGNPLKDSNGNVVGAIEFIMDTSELKEIQNYLARSTTNLLSEMDKFSSGDLTAKVEPEKKDDDIGRLFLGFNNAIGNIQNVVKNVQDAVQATASASSQISSSTEQMAAGAQEQSTQTNEVASAIEQMAATIIESTKSATRAAEAATDAGEIAKTGGEVVSETISGMNNIYNVVASTAKTVEELGDSSQKIGEITSVIDDIADQTNLLALNAAIEAARAGEQGRGFAVVADEVRKLAERTTKATKEITEMIKQIQVKTLEAVESIKSGTDEVEKGKSLAEKAGHSLTEIIDGSEKVVELIGQVAAASEEQSSAAELVSRNVEGISTVTQETAAGIHQMAKSAEDLNNLTANLQEMISRFKVEDHGLPNKLIN